MRLNNKGSFLYELIVCLLIAMMLITTCVIYFSKLSKDLIINRETYQMKQLLYANLMRLEKGEDLNESSDHYQLIITEHEICIEWTDQFETEKMYCEIYYK